VLALIDDRRDERYEDAAPRTLRAAAKLPREAQA